ncbi:MAG: D-lyxose/D-mannose family sugar isomerase [Candidatus Obscuribacter sp.]|nr:D-lyxose/D-mannose family sugar isomerase [Candidatus Obscuribacter sp.]
MKRSEINAAVARAIANSQKCGIALPRWAAWAPEEFGESAEGMRQQKLGWKVVDFGLGDFANCGLVVLVLANALADAKGEPVTKGSQVGAYQYPGSSFSRKFLFVQAGQTRAPPLPPPERAQRSDCGGGAPVTFELAWAESDTKLSERDVDVQVDGIWHHLPAHGKVTINPGETITLPGDLSHIISVAAGGGDVIMLETSTANNDAHDNIFPFITPTSVAIEEDTRALYQMLDEQR